MSATSEEGADVEVFSMEDVVLAHVGQIGALEETMQSVVEMLDDFLLSQPRTNLRPGTGKSFTNPTLRS